MRINFVKLEKMIFDIDNKRTSSPHITSLKENEIFVFGSNEAGIHGAGAAKQARKWGAIIGKGVGLQGNTYALPTKDKDLRTLSIDRIRKHVEVFTHFAKFNPNLKFQVTELGCGLAGYTPEEIGPLFAKAGMLKNVFLPESFLEAQKNILLRVIEIGTTRIQQRSMNLGNIKKSIEDGIFKKPEGLKKAFCAHTAKILYTKILFDLVPKPSIIVVGDEVLKGKNIMAFLFNLKELNLSRPEERRMETHDFYFEIYKGTEEENKIYKSFVLNFK